MEFNYTKVYNFEGAFRGMRAPMNSWDKSDSVFIGAKTYLGEKDLKLSKKLILSGSEHAKFTRQIFISADITAPMFWWKEMDTYKVGTVANSTSTMHKLTSKEINIDNFQATLNNLVVTENTISHGDEYSLVIEDYWEDIITMCENLRQKYLLTKDKRYWRALIEILPQSYLQTRTWSANYAILRNIYFQRKDHKLSEWHEFCEWVESLPYSEDLITIE